MNQFNPGLGHNNPPGPFIPEALDEKVRDFLDAAGAWLDLSEIQDDDRAQRATDFIAGAKSLHKEIDEERKRQKRPHDDAAQAVQDTFSPPMSKVKIAYERVGLMQTKFAQRKRDEDERRRREAANEARRREEEARRAAAAAEARNDISGIHDAQKAADEAAKAAALAERERSTKVASATGGARSMSIRTTWFAEVENINLAFIAFRAHPEVIATLERLATAEVRSQGPDKTAPAGFRLRKEEKAV